MIFVVTFVVMLLFIAFAGVGAIFAGKRLKGSCGGMGAIMGEDCAFCSKKEQCKRKKAQEVEAANF